MKFYEVSKEHQKNPSVPTKLPTRATKSSAGYDFYLKQNVRLKPNLTKLVYTDVKCDLADDEVLLIFPRSSVAIKNGVVLANGTGVIDADFFNNPTNDGNIAMPLLLLDNGNNSKGIVLRAGMRIAQGVVVKYQTDGAEVENQRSGGVGSTGK